MGTQVNSYRRWGKRLFDLLCVVPLIILAAPALMILSLIVRWNLGSPVLFRQQRLGRDNRRFTILKFRTMTDRRDSGGTLLPDEQRLTPLGRFLRATSLDELPQLWNVLLGHMSLVGPRPLLPEYLEHYTEEQKRRHEVHPGITGWVQVNGRNTFDWETKFQYDIYYVDHCSFLLDLKILTRTLAKVVSRSGIGHADSSVMPRFDEAAQSAMEGVIVLGGGGHAQVVASSLLEAGKKVRAILDDDQRHWGGDILGIPVTGPISRAKQYGRVPAIIAVGDNADRRRLSEQFELDWISVVHPRAYVHSSVHIGAGTVVMAGAVIQIGAQVGAHAIVNTAATVDHHGVLESFVHVAPGVHLGGSVHVGRGSFLGCGCSVVPGVVIGRNVTVGAGAAVIHDVPENVVAVGVPAKVIKHVSPTKSAA